MADVCIPEEISCSEQVFDINFHANANVFAAGLIDGTVDIWSYGLNDSNKLLFKNSFHTSSCRGVLFSPDGEVLYTISSDRSIQGLNGVGKQVFLNSLAHDDPINKIVGISETVFATGDDGGEVKLWDIRAPTAEIAKWQLHEDFVSGFCYDPESNTLLSVGGDATLCVYDIRNPKNNTRSDDQESELHCVQVIKNGKKVVCGSQDGVIQIFSWGRWGDCSDRFPGHPQTVDCMLKIDERTVITGSSDGLIRVVQILPNKVLGIVGDSEGFPVEGMCMSCDRRYLGSFAHDNTVRFWDVSMFADDMADGAADDDSEDEEQAEVSMNKNCRNHGGLKAGSSSSDRKRLGSGRSSVNAGDANSSDSDEDQENWEDCGSDDDDDDGADGAMAVEDVESEEDDSDSDDDSDNDGRSNLHLPTKAEKFFADL